jgi:hypothetical protein
MNDLPNIKAQKHEKHHNQLWAPALAAVLLCALLAGCRGGNSTESGTPVPLPLPQGNSQHISAKNLVHLWPLTIQEGTIRCLHGVDAVFEASGGKTYALNRRAKQDGYADIGPIRFRDHGHKVSLGALRSSATRLCKQ